MSNIHVCLSVNICLIQNNEPVEDLSLFLSHVFPQVILVLSGAIEPRSFWPILKKNKVDISCVIEIYMHSAAHMVVYLTDKTGI